MTETLVLSPEALKIYEAERKRKSNELHLIVGDSSENVDFSNPKVEKIVEDIYKQVAIASRDSMFYSLISKYWRMFELAEKHYQEKIDTYDLPHVFSITFSNFNAYLNPEKANDDELDNLGCIFYMFNFKSTTHRYLISPSTTWRLFSNIFKEHPTCSATIKDERIKNFCNCIDETSEVNFDKLLKCYYDVGGLQGMIDIAVECKLDSKLERSLLIIQKMLKDRVIEPIERFVDHKKTPIRIDENRYKEALENLTLYRPNELLNNKLIALNLALACYLTGQKIETTFFDENDKLYTICPTHYRAVANSRQAIEALRRLKGSDNSYVSCCPQFLSMLILIKNRLAKELGINAFEERIVYLAERRKCLERLRNKCFDMQFPQRFTMPEQCKSTKLLKKNLLSTHNYLRDLIKFGEQILPTIIEHVLEINTGNLSYHNEEGNKNYICYESVENLALFENLKYGEVAKESFKSICKAVTDTYKFLYEYATKNELIANMGFAPEKIDKLTELYNKVSEFP